MKHTFYLLFFALLACALQSCEKKEYLSYPPSWKGFECPENVKPGDTITIRAVQNKKGHLINATTYTWTIYVQREDGKEPAELGKSIKTNYDGTSNADPEITITIPNDAVVGQQVTVRFKAYYSFSANGMQGSWGKEQSGLSGILNSTSSTMSGDATGSVFFWIVDPN